MSTSRRLLNNTFLAVTARIAAKSSEVLLFIAIGRLIGPEDAGTFRLGKLFLTLALALSAWGLDDLLVRELAPRREQSGRYFANYIAMRLILALVAYAILIGLILFALPYSKLTSQVILIYSLAIFPEAALILCESLFTAHENLRPPTLVAILIGLLKLGGGLLVMQLTGNVLLTAAVIPLASILGLFAFASPIARLLRSIPQHIPARIDLTFSLEQLRFVPGFIVIGIFYNLNAQQDTLLISLMLGETAVGWYGAAQTILFGFLMLSSAVRITIYPIMARYQHEGSVKLQYFYQKQYQFFSLVIFPAVAAISLLATPLITLVYGNAFIPAGVALQWMIWEVAFTFLSIPNARLMLVNNRQKQLGWIMGLTTLGNLLLNLLLIPRYGIVAAAIINSSTAAVVFLSGYLYVQRHILAVNILPLIIKPFIATLIMAIVIWQTQFLGPLWQLALGIITYGVVIRLLQPLTPEDRQIFRQILGLSK